MSKELETKWVNAAMCAAVYLPENFEQEGADVTLENAYIPKHLNQPQKGLVTLYGFNGIRRGLVHAFSHAESEKLEMHAVHIKAPFDMVDENKVTISELKQTQMLNIRKTDKGLSALITLYYERFAKENNIDHPAINSIRTLVIVSAKNPDFFDYLIEQKEFKHLHVIAAPMEDEDGELLSRAIIYNKSRVRKRSITCDSLVYANIHLPDRVA